MKNVLFAGALLLAGVSLAPAQTLTNFDTATEGAEFMFRAPGFSGSTSANVEAATDVAAVSTAQSVSAPNSLRMFWDWTAAAPADARVRITTNGAAGLPNPTIDITKPLTFKVKMTQGHLSDLAILVRETASAGPIGANGGTANGIEIISKVTPVVLDAATNSDWQTVTFDFSNPSSYTVTAFAGSTADGVLSSATNFAVLEALYPRRGTSNAVEFFLDDFEQGTASPQTAASAWEFYE